MTASSPWGCLAMLAMASMLLMVVAPSMAFSPIYSPTSASSSKYQLHRTTIDRTAVDLGGGGRSLFSTTELSMIFKKNKKDDDDDLSFIETRDMTREEMQQYNQQFEDTVNQEIVGMTIFSLIISLPLLYLAWVGFFADTAEIAGEL